MEDYQSQYDAITNDPDFQNAPTEEQQKVKDHFSPLLKDQQWNAIVNDPEFHAAPMEDKQRVMGYFGEDRVNRIRPDLEELTGKGEFSRGVSKGLEQLQAMGYGAVGLGADILGADEFAGKMYEGYARNIEEAGAIPLSVERVEDIEGFGDAVDWFAGVAGTQLPNIATSILGGGVTGAIGKKLLQTAAKKAVEKKIASGVARKVAESQVKNRIATLTAGAGITAATGGMEGGSMWGEAVEDVGIEGTKPLAIAGLAGISGLSETLSPVGKLAKVFGGGELGVKAGRSFLKRLGVEVPKGMVGEGAQEGFQTFIGDISEQIHNPETSFADKVKGTEYLNSIAAGAALGGLGGGAVSAVQVEQVAQKVETQRDEDGFLSVDNVRKADALRDEVGIGAEKPPITVEPELTLDERKQDFDNRLQAYIARDNKRARDVFQGKVELTDEEISLMREERDLKEEFSTVTPEPAERPEPPVREPVPEVPPTESIYDVQRRVRIQQEGRKLGEELGLSPVAEEPVVTPEPEPTERPVVEKREAVVPQVDEMTEAINQGGINLGSAKQIFSPTTIAELGKKRPGLFRKEGGENIDEMAQSLGYETANDMQDSWSTAPTKKAEQMRLDAEAQAQFDIAEDARVEAERGEQVTFDGIKQRILEDPESVSLREIQQVDLPDARKTELLRLKSLPRVVDTVTQPVEPDVPTGTYGYKQLTPEENQKTQNDFRVSLNKVLRSTQDVDNVMSILDARSGSLGMKAGEYLQYRGVSIVPDSKAFDTRTRQANKAAVQIIDDSKAIIHAFEKADASSIHHELFHIFRRDLQGQDLRAAERYAGVKHGEEWSTAAEEKITRAYENYLRTGKAPTTRLKRAFDKISETMRRIYQTVKGSDIDVEITPEITALFDKMLTPGASDKFVRDKAGGVLFQSAYHGGPRKVDKFSTDFIGTGEGAQAYGWGMYFADSKEVADYYRKTLSGKNVIQGYAEDTDINKFKEKASAISQNESDEIADMLQDSEVWKVQSNLKYYEPDVATVFNEVFAEDKGKLYKVDLKPKEDEYLVWDRELKNQSEKVQSILRNIPEDVLEKADDYPSNEFGRNVYLYLRSAVEQGDNTIIEELKKLDYDPYSAEFGTEKTDKLTSQYLHSIGIRGIKYEDGASRGKFDHVPITDERRNEITDRLDYIQREGVPKAKTADEYKALNDEMVTLQNKLAMADADPKNYNYVIFNDEDVSIEDVLFQSAPPTDSEAFKKWFGDSKVVDENGDPLVVYHGTNAEFDTFDPNMSDDFGIHFGTEEQARAFSERPDEYYINISNPLELDFDATMVEPESEYHFDGSYYDNIADSIVLSFPGVNHPSELYNMSSSEQETLLDDMYDKTKIADEYALESLKHDDLRSLFGAKEVKEFYNSVKNVIRAFGFDGVFYENEMEGEGTSYIVFNPEQIKSATKNVGTFSPETGNIYMQANAPSTPATRRATGFIGKAADMVNISDERKDIIATRLWDRLVPVKRIQGRAKRKLAEDENYLLHRRVAGRKSADEVKRLKDNTIDPLLKTMADADISIKDAGDYMWAEHASERNLQMKRTRAMGFLRNMMQFMTDKEASEFNDRIFDAKHESDMTLAEIDKARDGYIEIMDGMQARIPEWETKLQTLTGKRLTNAQERLETRKEIIEKWEDVKDRLSGLTDEQAANRIAELDSPQMRKVADAWRKINENALLKNLEAGELTQEEYDQITRPYKKHVPLYREDQDFENPKTPVGLQSLGTIGSPVKTAYGSTSAVENVIPHIVDRAQGAIERKHRLDGAKILYNMAMMNPEMGLSLSKQPTSPGRDSDGNLIRQPRYELDSNQWRMKVDGETYVLEVDKTDKEGMRFVESLLPRITDLGPVLNATRKMNQLLAKMNTTFNPEFIITNFGRDIQMASVMLEDTEGGEGAQKEVLKGTTGAIKGIYQTETGKDGGEWGKWWNDMKENGGKISFLEHYDTIEDLAKKLETDLAYIKGDKSMIKQKGKATIEWIAAMNTSVENGVRLSTYRYLVENGMSRKKAAKNVANLTVDFNRSGTWGPVANSLYMFANAGVIGNARMIQALVKSPKVQKLAAGVVGAGMMQGALNAMLGGYDDDGESYYDKLRRSNPSLFERNMIWMLPGTKGEYVKFPLAYGLNVFYKTGEEMSTAVRDPQGYSPMKGAMSITSTFMNAFNPVASSTIIQTISPTVTDPIVQSYENKNWFGGDLMPAKNPYGMSKPDSERYWRGVNPVAKTISRGLNRLTGGDKIEGGVIDISPETLENVFGTFAGGIGRFIGDTTSLPYEFVKGEKGAKDVPFVRKLVGKTSEYVDNKIYKENIARVEVAERRYKAAETQRAKRKAGGTDEYKMVDATKSTERRLRKLKKKLRTAQDKGNDVRVKRLEKQIRDIQRRYNRKFNRIVKP